MNQATLQCYQLQTHSSESGAKLATSGLFVTGEGVRTEELVSGADAAGADL